ncbi:aldehyde dehydrogenase family protein, partial [Mariniblastus sp.]|nr:aldehyde dehydrogenase family protein [Mariniblastus sp.]
MNQANSTTTLNFINGQYCDPIGDGWLENINPADGTSLGKIANSTEQDVERAVIAAANAQPQWSESTLEQRSRILSKIGDLIEENLESLAIAESEDSGKPIGRARTIEIPRAASNFHFFANAITQFSSESHESVGQNAINFTLRQPLDVVGCISPWNLPLYLFTWKIAPALAAGNCVIAKPSE